MAFGILLYLDLDLVKYLESIIKSYTYTPIKAGQPV